jgi:hypothetical protein
VGGVGSSGTRPTDERTAVGTPGRESCLLVLLLTPCSVEYPMKKAIVALLLGAAIVTTATKAS